MGAAGAERLAAVFASALRVPLLVKSLGVSDYGLWLSTSGLTGTLQWLSLGLPTCITNRVAETRILAEPRHLRSTVASGFILTSVVALLAAAGASFLALVLPVGWLLGLSPGQERVARMLVVLCGFSVAASLGGAFAPAALAGFQEQYRTSLWRGGAACGQIAGLVVLIRWWPGNLLLTAAFLVAWDVMSQLAFAVWVCTSRPALRPEIGAASRPEMRRLAGTGVFFMLGDVANYFRLVAPTLVLSHQHGPASVPALAVPLQLFQVSLGVAGLISASFWPAYVDATARRDWPWLVRAQRRVALVQLLIGGAFAASLVASGQDLLTVWVGASLVVPLPQIAFHGAWLVLQTWNNVIASALGAMSRSRHLALAAAVEGGLVFGASLFLGKGLGSSGVALGQAMGAFGLATVVLPAFLRKASDEQLRVPVSLPVRVVVAAGLAAVVGLVVRAGLPAAPVLVRFFVTALLALASFGALALAFLSREDRAEFANVVRGAGRQWGASRSSTEQRDVADER